MNKLVIFALNAVLISTALSCRKATDEVAPDTGVHLPNTPATAAVTPVGTPVGEIMTATIGPAGGSIQSADERIRVDIPAGALTASQTISVQPLDKNHCPGGTGSAFRLLPHGLTFARPATITVNYDEQDLEGTAPELLRIAYQNEQKSWQSPITKSLDTTARTLRIETNHFSDWALLKGAVIEPSVTAIDPGASVKLLVTYNIFESDSDNERIPTQQVLDDKYIKRWTLERGEGAIDQNGTHVATYIAPERIPATNPAVVAVVLSMKIGNVQREIRVRSKIYVLGEGLIYRINGGPWIPTTAPLGLSRVQVKSGYYFTVQTGSVIPGISSTVNLSWPVTGLQEENGFVSPWKLKTSDNDLLIPQLTITTGSSSQRIYAFYYAENQTAHPSPGELRVSRTVEGKGKPYHVGSFTMMKAGILEYSGGTDQVFDGVAKVEGYFRLSVARNL